MTAPGLPAPQMAAVRQALADAAAYRRAMIAAWCDRCETAPDGCCPEHLADLEAAQTYDALARELAAAERGDQGGEGEP